MNLQRQGNSYLVDVEFRGGLLEKRKEIGFPPGLVAPVDSGVAGLSATAGVDERRAVAIATPEAPSREAVESHMLTHIPFAPWCRACISGRGREAPHFRQGGEETVATPVISLDYFFLGLTDSSGDGTTPTLALCDGNTTCSLGLMVPRRGPVPYAVRGVCVFLQELGYTRMVLKSDGEPSITALVTDVQKEWAGDSKNFQRQLIPRTTLLMITRQTELSRQWCAALKGSPERARLPWKRLWESRFWQLLRFCRGWSNIRVTSETDLSCDQVAEHLFKS